MSYERKDIPALIVEFQKAKRDISKSEGVDYFLCNALGRSDADEASTKARELVREAISGHFTLQDWFLTQGRPMFLDNSGSSRLRIRWCDKIIRDLKKYAK